MVKYLVNSADLEYTYIESNEINLLLTNCIWFTKKIIHYGTLLLRVTSMLFKESDPNPQNCVGIPGI